MEFKRLTDDEIQQWEALADNEFGGYEDASLDDEARSILAEVCESVAICDNDDDLIHLNGRCGAEIQKWMGNPTFARFLVRAYEHFVASGSAGACCNLGAIYLSGVGVAENAELARELYEMGAERGDSQSAVNLGYFYYYGRGPCDVDYVQAFECYASAAFVDGNPEAYWKLGDLYAGGRGVRKSGRMAWLMYSKAYERGHGTVYAGRAAHHLADCLLNGVEGVVEPDPERALALYTEAEIGYYQSIEIGLGYYKGCLEEAKAGQEKARAALVELRTPKKWDDAQ